MAIHSNAVLHCKLLLTAMSAVHKMPQCKTSHWISFQYASASISLMEKNAFRHRQHRPNTRSSRHLTCHKTQFHPPLPTLSLPLLLHLLPSQLNLPASLTASTGIVAAAAILFCGGSVGADGCGLDGAIIFALRNELRISSMSVLLA